jgi:arylsulfatase A-like enzyme
MKRLSFILLGLVIGFTLYSQEKPNVIVIMADDLGYGDVGFNGSIEIPTPNIDRIAENGVAFTSAYTTYCVCGPSRAGFITGRYQQSFGFERNPLYRVNDPFMGLPKDEMTIAESVSQVGYTSGVIGKWHLGAHISNHPLNRGFDEFYGHLGGGHRYFPEDLTITNSYNASNESESYLTWIMRDHAHEPTDEYITDEFSNEAVDFVVRHKDDPFFLFLSYNAPHGPMQAKAEDMALFPHLTDESGRMRKTYAGMVHAVDRGVGRVLDKLQELNMEENTIVIFLSDNGGPESKNASDNGVLRGGKSDVWEGGYRVPFAMQWKETLDPGMVYDYPISSLDIFATLSELSGSPTNPEKPLDGVNLIPYLSGENNNEPHEAIYIRKFDQNRHAVRNGVHKLIYLSDFSNKKLFDLSTNISESDSKNLYFDAGFLERRNELDTMRVRWEEGLIHPRFLGLVHDELVWATSVSLSETNLTVSLIAPRKITATILPEDAFNDVIEWSSTNPSVATVDQSGTILGHTIGYAVITARVADRRQVFEQCIVKVGNPVAATGISLSENNINILHGRTAQLTATVSDSNDSYAVEWSSSNTSVATVDENGFVLTHALGSAIITAIVIGSEEISATCTILVSNQISSVRDEKNQTIEPDKISVFPNPVASLLHVEMKHAFLRGEIHNINGKLVWRGLIAGGTINVADLTDGVYILRLEDDRNTSIRFIKSS